MAADRNQAARVRLMLMRDEADDIPVFDRHQLEIPQSLWNQVDNLHDAALIAFRQWHMKRKELLDKIAEVEADLRSLEKGCNVSMVVGSSVSAAGGIAIVAGLVIPLVAVGGRTILFESDFFTLIYFLFRENNILISGLIVCGVAAASNVTTSLVKIGVAKKKLKEIEVMLHQDAHNFNSLNEALIRLGEYLELLRDRYPELDNPDVAISSSVFSLLQMGSTGITAAVRSALFKESAVVSAAFARGAVGVLAAAGVVLDGIFIVLSSRDLAKGSPSALADKLSMARGNLEQHLFENCETISMLLGIENPHPRPINESSKFSSDRTAPDNGNVPTNGRRRSSIDRREQNLHEQLMEGMRQGQEQREQQFSWKTIYSKEKLNIINSWIYLDKHMRSKEVSIHVGLVRIHTERSEPAKHPGVARATPGCIRGASVVRPWCVGGASGEHDYMVPTRRLKAVMQQLGKTIRNKNKKTEEALKDVGRQMQMMVENQGREMEWLKRKLEETKKPEIADPLKEFSEAVSKLEAAIRSLTPTSDESRPQSNDCADAPNPNLASDSHAYAEDQQSGSSPRPPGDFVPNE
ncbi:hypothetical protein WR25_00752 [Diploscapter pachys]|uniref:Uncharacterized protein n=1 Tax=Diploscapter pachys TaxID=2018661 RepID=A0A2A2LEU4_9BILA|nr:hypothetical protein WR25_00752 [Diploscapter pachys]